MSLVGTDATIFGVAVIDTENALIVQLRCRLLVYNRNFSRLL